MHGPWIKRPTQSKQMMWTEKEHHYMVETNVQHKTVVTELLSHIPSPRKCHRCVSDERSNSMTYLLRPTKDNVYNRSIYHVWPVLKLVFILTNLSKYIYKN